MRPNLRMASPLPVIRSVSPRPVRLSTSVARRVCLSAQERLNRFSPTTVLASKEPRTSSISGRSASPPGSILLRSTARRGLRGARALDAAFFDEEVVIRVVGDIIVLAPALIASEDDIAVIVSKLADILERLR
jgi:hypothetical protein